MEKRTFLLVFLAYGLVIAGLVTLRGELLALAVPVVSYLLAGFLQAPENIQLEIQRSLSCERTAPDVPVQIKLTVQNKGSDLGEVILEDAIPPDLQVRKGSIRHMLNMPRGKTFSWTYEISGRRGYYIFSNVKVETRDLFGLINRKKIIPTKGQLFVLPPTMRLRHLAIRPRRTNVYSGTIPARIGGPGVEFFGVREYERGDPPAWINWRVSARQPLKLFSNEFEQERVADVGIILDGRKRTNTLREGHSLFEYSIQAAGAMADTFLAQGNRVGVLLYGHYLHWTIPGYGKIQRERIMQRLAQAEPGESLVFDDLGHIPTKLFPAHSQLVLVSPLVPEDFDVLLQLRAHGYQVMVISPNPVAFEMAYLPQHPEVVIAGRIVQMEREMLLERLRHAGVQVLDWNVGIPFDQIAPAALGRPLAWFRAIGR